MFADNNHLDLAPFDENAVLEVHVSLVKPLPQPRNAREQAEALRAKAALTDWALAMGRKHREAELAMPVTQVEVEFADDWGLRGRLMELAKLAPADRDEMRRKLRRCWDFTFDDLKAMEASADYALMKTAAEARGFSTHMNGRFFHTTCGDLRVQLKLTFVRLRPEPAPEHPAKGRTYRKRVTP